MCSTTQSPRVANAFSRAWAARTCPAPEDADKSRTRGFRFIRGVLRLERLPSRGLAASGGNFFEDSARHALQLAKTRQVVLKFVVQQFCFFRAKLCAQNHVAQLDGMGQKRVLFQFFERHARVVVIHESPQAETGLDGLDLGRRPQPLYSPGAATSEHQPFRAKGIPDLDLDPAKRRRMAEALGP